MATFRQVIAIPIALLALLCPLPGFSLAQPGNTEKRSAWNTSRIQGSPESPPPYRPERVFPKLSFKNPVLITPAPFGHRMVVGEQGGKIWSFAMDPASEKPDLMLDLAAGLKPDTQTYGGFEALYGLAFHPRFDENRYCFLCYVLRGKNGPHPQGTKVSRFRVGGDNTIEIASEKPLLNWLGGGHNGGDLHFGNDGMLYISTGDGTDPAPPDRLGTGQDISDLLGSILRIDVDQEGKDGSGRPLPYSIPPDNPFVNTPQARPEVWAYGFRNPWRMSFDRPTGDLWVGDVGWELHEMVYRVTRGGNYGWSVMEGPQVVNPEGKRGPTPILPPTISFPHTEAASITGGHVYRGKRLKELESSYICGDWVTRKIWETRFEGGKLVRHRELAQTGQQIIAFGQGPDQELYFLDYREAGGIYRLVPHETTTHDPSRFPRKLSETGLYQSADNQLPAPGVYPFQINSERFADHAQATRLVAFPGTSSARFYDRAIPIPETFFSGQVFLPKDGVLAKTLSLPVKTRKGFRQQPVETQVLHYDGKTWNAYSYAWNEEASDAELVPSGGLERGFTVQSEEDPSGMRSQTWRYPARSQCLTCHNPWAGQALAFTPMQLDREIVSSPHSETELSRLKKLGLVEFRKAEGDQLTDTLTTKRLTAPWDGGGSLEERARSYLHVNCSHCHQFGAGGTATIDLRHQIPLAEAKLVGVKPVQGSFELPEASLITAGNPYRSALYYRMAKTGAGHMPHLGAELVDTRGLGLVHDWIAGMQPGVRSADRLSGQALDAWKKLASESGLDTASLKTLLENPVGALVLAHGLDGPVKARPGVLAAIGSVSKPEVRDVLERFLPADQRPQRLGTQIDARQLLATQGNLSRGKELFFLNSGPRCASCHRVDGAGSTLGPDLSGIGRKYSREQILEQILQPSKTIEPQYATQLVETGNGKLVSGLLVRRTDTEVILRSAEDKEIRIAAGEVVSMRGQAVSAMPEMLLRDLTAQQAADLLEYLASLKKDNAPAKGTGGG